MNANPVFSLHIPTKILFGCGELRKLATEKLPGKKALIVISSGTSMKKYGYLDKVVELLQETIRNLLSMTRFCPTRLNLT